MHKKRLLPFSVLVLTGPRVGGLAVRSVLGDVVGTVNSLPARRVQRADADVQS